MPCSDGTSCLFCLMRSMVNFTSLVVTSVFQRCIPFAFLSVVTFNRHTLTLAVLSRRYNTKLWNFKMGRSWWMESKRTYLCSYFCHRSITLVYAAWLSHLSTAVGNFASSSESCCQSFLLMCICSHTVCCC